MNKTLVVGVVILLGACLAVGWWLVSPLFIDTIINEETTLKTENTILYVGGFVDADSTHHVRGSATIFEGSGARILRFEDFDATNGPDLEVYLAVDRNASEYVSLGPLKGNIGNQSYVIGSDVDLDKYDVVLIWCRAFGALFGSAELGRAG
jgi:hypothetical protein